MSLQNKKKRILLILAGLFLLSILFFIWLANEAMRHQNFIDRQFTELRKNYVTASSLRFMKIITFFGDRKFLLPCYTLLTIILLIRQRYRVAMMIPVAGIGAAVLETGFKSLFQRMRPEFQEIPALTGYSFPSGHALSSMVFYGVVIVLVWHFSYIKKWKWVIGIFLFCWIVLIGFSRIILNVHYATDIIGGWLAGAGWVTALYACYIAMAQPGYPKKL